MQYKALESTFYFHFALNDNTGEGADGSTPLYDVRLCGAAASAAPVYSGTPTLLTHANYPAGCFEIAIAATTANGFIADNQYAVFCTALVSSVNPTGFVGEFTTTALMADTDIPGAVDNSTKVIAIEATVNHADYGNAKLVRSTTPANTLSVDANHGVIANLTYILGTLLTETTGYLAAGFKKFFNIVTPVLTVASVNQTGDSFIKVDQLTFTTANKVDATVTGGGDATAANQTTIIGHLTDIKGGTWADETMVTLQTAVEAIGSLTGSNAITLTIQAPSGINIVDAFVDVYDSGNTTFYGRLTTNSSGQVSFSRDNGTYIIRILKAGYVFTNQTLVVNGVEAETYIGTAYAPAAPAAASICRVYEYAYDPDGTPMADVKAYAKINTMPYNANAVLYAGQNITAEYNSTTGLLYWDLVQASSVKFVIKDLGIDYIKTIPASSTVRLSDI